MIFESELCDLILTGKKTQTRCAARGADHALADGGIIFLVSSGEGGRVRWEVGRTYAVHPGWGKRAVARIRVAAIRYCERAGDISEADAIAEGFASAEGFRAVYARINGAGALECACWALTFRMVFHGDYAPFFGLAQEWVDEIAALRARLAAAERRTEALVTTLEWYADETHYDEQGVVIGRGEGPKYIGAGDPQEAWYEGDFGERARVALAGCVDAPTGGDDGKSERG